MIPSEELLSRISSYYSNSQLLRLTDETNDTARSWKVLGYRGSFGFISSMSDHFCSSCNRLRITADGQIKVGISHLLLYVLLLIFRLKLGLSLRCQRNITSGSYA
jgi:molybdenum cofactor biosynthesis enzyme MoaA